jgi:hypothetical protein
MTYQYLESRPDRASGELTIKGTRIRIAQVINMLAHGFTLQELHTEHFPHVSDSISPDSMNALMSNTSRMTLLCPAFPIRRFMSLLSPKTASFLPKMSKTFASFYGMTYRALSAFPKPGHSAELIQN